MLHETHIVGHMKLEVTLAEVKQEKASSREFASITKDEIAKWDCC